MQKNHLKVLAFAICALLTSAAPGVRAQGIQSAADSPQKGEEVRGDTGVVEIREVERGIYFSVDVGPNYFLSLDIPGFVPINETWLQPGTRFGLRGGYDILNNLNIEAFTIANFNRGVVKAERLQSGQVTGDISSITTGIGGRFAFITTKRLFVFARAGAGLSVWYPAEMTEGSLTSSFADDFALGLSIDSSVGVEYYTHLRHISVGLELAAQGLVLPMAVGFMVYPTFKYTF